MADEVPEHGRGERAENTTEPDTADRLARTAIRGPKLWLAPVLVVSLLMSVLAAVYMGGILDPKKSLHDFPIALVVSDEGDVLPTGEQANFGNQIRDGLVAGIDPNTVDLRQMGIAQAHDELDSGEVFGAIVIPSDFTKRLSILAEASVVAGDVDKPVITVYTNPRAGTLGSSLFSAIGDQALGEANTKVGQQLTESVQAQLAAGQSMSGAAALTLADPIDIIVTPHDPLPDGTGLGLSAFYYALLLLLAGFTGAMVVSALVDSVLGFTPTEFGPFFRHTRAAPISRLQTMFVKWALMAILGVVVSALYLWISTALGMPSSHSLLLWMYGALAITAVGVTAVSIVSVFGTLGLLINLILFVVLGLPSAGATVPISAAPRLFGWLAQFEPMHQVYLAVRAILYFDARWDAGLGHGVTATLIGTAIGLVFGFVVVRFYDRKGFERRDGTLVTSRES
ncbi:DUF3533 domain-containing protein [Rhodococcoides kyotonense]|uniref:YhgE/Pip N-terminal domain-containing protein n=1 Tax=Rhodococcoides kyotonense TaxID=398843 RepID=A0A239JSM4_9NOCA|nr:DUF3533 domain-containing protein [Rhodococcus kyotonensis]SNT08847.1 YhgE/Pip N-terminal domain-containing protein [Rhodococcus kyotonensis]